MATSFVHPDTDEPTRAWEKLRVRQAYKRCKPMDLLTPVSKDKVRFVCVSDTHNLTDKMPPLPPGDVLLHAGDFTRRGFWDEVVHFNNWLGTLQYKHKIVIAGNHELSFDPQTASHQAKYRKKVNAEEEGGVANVRDLLTNCTYLEDAEVQVCGIRIYGSPWQPEFCDWAFNLPRGAACLAKWNMIPDHTDVLMTHGPPIGHGDLLTNGHRAGCVELLNTIQHRVKPKYHVCGHIHEDPGVSTDGQTVFINASIATLWYKAENPPVIFDLPLPEGFTKDSISHVTPAVCCEANSVHIDCNDDDSDEIVFADTESEKADNFMEYCEVAQMSESLGDMDFGPGAAL